MRLRRLSWASGVWSAARFPRHLLPSLHPLALQHYCLPRFRVRTSEYGRPPCCQSLMQGNAALHYVSVVEKNGGLLIPPLSSQASTASRPATGAATRAAAPSRRRQVVTKAQSKDITFDQESRQKIQRGIDKLADAVGVTLGPRGTRESRGGRDVCTTASRSPPDIKETPSALLRPQRGARGEVRHTAGEDGTSRAPIYAVGGRRGAILSWSLVLAPHAPGRVPAHPGRSWATTARRYGSYPGS